MRALAHLQAIGCLHRGSIDDIVMLITITVTAVTEESRQARPPHGLMTASRSAVPSWCRTSYRERSCYGSRDSVPLSTL